MSTISIIAAIADKRRDRKESAIIMSHAFRHEAFQGINHGTCGNHGT